MDLIRVVGTAIGGVAASLVALTASPLTTLLTAGFFVLYRGVEDYLLVPRIVGRWSFDTCLAGLFDECRCADDKLALDRGGRGAVLRRTPEVVHAVTMAWSAGKNQNLGIVPHTVDELGPHPQPPLAFPNAKFGLDPTGLL